MVEKTDLIWMDGRLVQWDEAKIHIISHSLHYGTADFEGIRIYKTDNGKSAIFRLEDHIKRLFYTARMLYMDIPFTKEEISKAIVKTAKRNCLEEGYIRPLVYYGHSEMGVSPKEERANIAIAVWLWKNYLGEKPARVKTSEVMRMHPKSSIVDAKISGNYANSFRAGKWARKAKYDEALLLDHLGYVAEGPGENFFIVKNREILTPRLGNILPGITRDSIMKIARDIGYSVREIKMELPKIYKADEAFFTGTAAEVHPILSIDDKIFEKAPGPITLELKTEYSNIIHGRNAKYKRWLTFV